MKFMKPKPKDFFTDSSTVAMLNGAIRDDLRTVERAVADGADPNARGRDGITPLAFSLFYPKRIRGISALLEAGADPNYDPSEQPSALGLVVQHPNPQLLKTFLDHGGDPNLYSGTDALIFTAAMARRWRNVQLLIDYGADIDQSLGLERTLLMMECASHDWEGANIVLDMGANPRATDYRNQSVADYVRRNWPRGDRPTEFNRFLAALAARGVEVTPPDRG